MGTSKGIGLPTGGEWTPLKNDINNFAKNGETPTRTPGSLLNGFLAACGGADRIARGDGRATRGGGTGGGGGGGIGRAARNAGQNFGGFLSSVNTLGFDEALRERGLSDLIGHTAADVVTGLLDVLIGPASTLDEDATRDAFVDLNGELVRDNAPYDELKRLYTESLNEQGTARLLARFFALYVFRLVSRYLSEKLLKQEPQDKRGHTLKSIKQTIKAKLDAELFDRDVARINWNGAEGRRITETIFKQTLRIYEASS